MEISLQILATEANYNEAKYLTANPDVAAAVLAGVFPNGRVHFRKYGHKERRSLDNFSAVELARKNKITRIKPLIKFNLPHFQNGLKYNFLTEELRKETGIIDTHAISSNGYDGYVHDMIASCSEGIILDCGAGRRPTYYSNVINYEIVDYDTTDIIGVGEELPFKDNSFDGVISVAVLEHVRDPFSCAAEIIRVLRPGGRLFCAVPFLQPEHGYPHHYYNMAPQGLRALFERSLTIDEHKVYGSVLPVWALRWIVQSWADGLVGPIREKFLSMPLSDLIEPEQPADILQKNWVVSLSKEKNFELACATVLFAHKPI